MAGQEGRYLGLVLLRGRCEWSRPAPRPGASIAAAFSRISAPSAARCSHQGVIMLCRHRLLAERALAGAGRIRSTRSNTPGNALARLAVSSLSDDGVSPHPCAPDFGAGSRHGQPQTRCNSKPCPCRASASWLVLPPGAAQKVCQLHAGVYIQQRGRGQRWAPGHRTPPRGARDGGRA